MKTTRLTNIHISRISEIKRDMPFLTMHGAYDIAADNPHLHGNIWAIKGKSKRLYTQDDFEQQSDILTLSSNYLTPETRKNARSYISAYIPACKPSTGCFDKIIFFVNELISASMPIDLYNILFFARTAGYRMINLDRTGSTEMTCCKIYDDIFDYNSAYIKNVDGNEYIISQDSDQSLMISKKFTKNNIAQRFCDEKYHCIIYRDGVTTKDPPRNKLSQETLIRYFHEIMGADSLMSERNGKKILY